MSTETNASKAGQLWIRWVVIVLPTVLISAFVLRQVNFSYTALSTGIGFQTLWLAAGLVLAYTVYFFRARLVVSVLLLAIVYVVMQRVIAHLPGEFDVFYTTARFELYSTLFFLGWFFGLLLVRLRWGYVGLFALLLTASLVVASDTVEVTFVYFLRNLAPTIVYGVYMFFISTAVETGRLAGWRGAGRGILRTALFIALVLLMFLVVEPFFRGELTAVEKELAARGAREQDKKGQGGDGYDDRYGLMEKRDDSFRLKDTMRVNSRMSQSDQLMFCAKVDNFFPDGTPAPLYFVYHHLTKYDPRTESFTRDLDVPSLDEFDIDPSEIPLYQVAVDTSIIRKAMGPQLRKQVTTEIYLSSNSWKHALLGPASVYAVQPIPVEKDFQKQFYAAYRVSSYTSELNNAYFVYNISANPFLGPLQEQRHEVLRKVRDYDNLDRAFYDYYTTYPKGGIYDSIAKLAQRLAPPDATPLEKVLAVRDHFLARNAAGKRIFRYTLKPGSVGDQNIPSSQMLYNFLFKTKAGYCTYYAGASLFMLRALGVPTRFTTGFATVDRSDKNKGWYWFYASQAHAWTQVYFPEYGWMDFDMTIGNEDQQSAPKPDGTPPLPPPEPWLVLNARAESVRDTPRALEASFRQLIFYDKGYRLPASVTQSIDASLCRIVYDKKDTTWAALQPGDSVIIVSYKDEAKKRPAFLRGVPIEEQVRRFPSPLVVDEIHIKPRPDEKKRDEPGGRLAREEKPGPTWREILIWGAVALGAIVVFLLLFPALILCYYLLRAATARSGPPQADWVYRSTLYRLHMAGFEREGQTPLAYAEQTVDPKLDIGFGDFMRLYLRLKYGGASLRPGDEQVIRQLQQKLGRALRHHRGVGSQIVHYLHPWRAWRFFQSGQEVTK